jgi:predicted RecB family nuclease
MNTKRACEKGHTYYKSSDCPTCPICAAAEKPATGLLSKLSAPARRALQAIGVSTTADLARFTESEILALHGFGPSGLAVVKAAMQEEGIAFRGD